ncbi:MAG: GTPase [Planctomycetota bacterium]
MRGDDTIAAIATAHGASPRAIVRLSGGSVQEVLRDLLRPCPAFPGIATAAVQFEVSSLPVAVITAVSPRSYTGDDTAELLLPGNPHLVDRVMSLLKSRGVRQAGPGEFSARAYLAGKLTLEQAEGVAAVIAADRDDDLAAARDILEGTAGVRYAELLDSVASLLALVEAGIDFTDQEDVVPIPPAHLAEHLVQLHAELAARAGDDARADAGQALPVVVLAGPPNAGKSTLFNALLGRERAVTSNAPGTTRDAIEETLRTDDHAPGVSPVTLVDLAGIGEAAVSGIDAAAQRVAAARIAQADLIVLCDPAGRFDLDVPETARVVRVRTKADQPGLTSEGLAVCAIDGFGLVSLRDAIAANATSARRGVARHAVARHAGALRDAADAISDALRAIDPQATSLVAPEVVAAALRSSLDALGTICGHVSADDVIGRVFATFCVGK